MGKAWTRRGKAWATPLLLRVLSGAQSCPLGGSDARAESIRTFCVSGGHTNVYVVCQSDTNVRISNQRCIARYTNVCALIQAVAAHIGGKVLCIGASLTERATFVFLSRRMWFGLVLLGLIVLTSAQDVADGLADDINAFMETIETNTGRDLKVCVIPCMGHGKSHGLTWVSGTRTGSLL